MFFLVHRKDVVEIVMPFVGSIGHKQPSCCRKSPLLRLDFLILSSTKGIYYAVGFYKNAIIYANGTNVRLACIEFSSE